MIVPDQILRFRPGNAGREKRSAACAVLLLLMIPLFLPGDLRAETYIFVGSNFPVLSEKQSDGTLVGVGIDIVRIVCSRIGHTPDIRLYPWARAQELVKFGLADVLIAPYQTPERKKWMDFSNSPFFEDESLFFIRPDSRISWNGDFTSVQQYRIGMVLKWSVGPDFENAKRFLSIDYARTIDLCFQKLMAGRVDLVPTQLREALAAFDRIGLDAESRPVMIRPALAQHHNYFGFSRKNRTRLKEFKAAFEKELLQMRRSGEINQLIRKTYHLQREVFLQLPK